MFMFIILCLCYQPSRIVNLWQGTPYFWMLSSNVGFFDTLWQDTCNTTYINRMRTHHTCWGKQTKNIKNCTPQIAIFMWFPRLFISNFIYSNYAVEWSHLIFIFALQIVEMCIEFELFPVNASNPIGAHFSTHESKNIARKTTITTTTLLRQTCNTWFELINYC